MSTCQTKANNHGQELTLITCWLQAIDRHNCGTVNTSEFLRALTILCLHNVVSTTQVEALEKCFSKPRGMRDEVDYRAFLNAIAIVKQNWKAKGIWAINWNVLSLIILLFVFKKIYLKTMSNIKIFLIYIVIIVDNIRYVGRNCHYSKTHQSFTKETSQNVFLKHVDI